MLGTLLPLTIVRLFAVLCSSVRYLQLHLSRSLVDRWGATDDLATSSLHSSRLSAFLMAAASVMLVHSGMLSTHLFFCLPLLLLPSPAGLSWQALKILLRARTISVCVVLLWSIGLRGAQWLAEFCFAPFR